MGKGIFVRVDEELLERFNEVAKSMGLTVVRLLEGLWRYLSISTKIPLKHTPIKSEDWLRASFLSRS